ncbi:Acyl transferase domain-containing protein [Streptomyces sp. DI166]|uniref:type I polyketide synthase n=1 Tax=Streptomyces sp. DI166 TaxID=1839783 RepID=UPI0007F48D0C|nr:type I polyketide synthase [Streptomyces sp. DI166]SBT94568.1 Acyl transferase domain-containing protein [Streptomyces sp. DI166]
MTGPGQGGTSADTLKRAYLTMERLQRRIEEYERARSEPIAVVGVGCRFPGGVTDTETYWQLLVNGVDAIRDIPADRWDNAAFYDEEQGKPGVINTRSGGFLDRIDRFDHDFFGISRREALAMDPHQRLTLEVAWEALENAGQAPTALAGSRTGVFMGVASSDHVTARIRGPEDVTAYTSSGAALSFIPGRIAYLLDLRGPNVAVDTACSSSLVAVHQACQSLRSGECDTALAGGVNVVLSPVLLISQSQFGSVSRQGRAKSFSDDADGYVRGEGCGIVVLKRLSDAVRDGDQVLALVRGGAVNQDGRSSGITAPNGAAQREVYRAALAASGVEPHQVGLIETHGTGTRLGDPIEAESLADVYGRPTGSPVYLGAVKTNFGHLEAAAGAAGLIKAALCLAHGEIPPNLHFTRLNTNISFAGTTFTVPTQVTAWPEPEGGRRFAAVSSFGLSGTNAHLILQQADPAPAPAPDERRPASVLPLSARTETALEELARRYRDRLRAPDDTPLADLCHSAGTGRAHFRHRLAAVGADREEVAARLDAFLRGDGDPGLVHDEAEDTDVVFLFTGQGAQRPGMTARLYQTQPTFRRTLDTCAEILRPLLGRPLLSVLFPADPADTRINDTAYAQPATFAVEYATAQLWRSWGVEPAAVLGHSFGECVAACVAGAMSLEDGLAFTVERARIIEQFCKPGTMAAVFAPEAEVAARIADDLDRISIAAVNGPANTTISGERDLVEEICAEFTARGITTKPLHIASAGHSPLMDPVLDPLRKAARRIAFKAPAVPLVSNVTGGLWPWDQAPDAEHWCRHVRRTVRFADGVRTLHDLGYRAFLEVGPAPTLLGLVSDALPPDHDDLLLPSLRPRTDDWEVLLPTVAALYARGATVDWAGFDRDYTRARTVLPTYPFDPTDCWEPPRPWHRTEAPAGTASEAPRQEAATAAPARRRGRRRNSPIPTAEELLGLPEAERLPTLTEQFLRAVQHVLGSASASAGLDEPLTGLGLDSLMAVELRNDLQNRLNVTLQITDFLGGATIRSVARTVLDRLASGDGTSGPAEETPRAHPSPIRRRRRSEERAAADVLAELGEASGGTADALAQLGEADAPGGIADVPARPGDERPSGEDRP